MQKTHTSPICIDNISRFQTTTQPASRACFAIVGIGLILAAGCTAEPAKPTATEVLRLATTTSTRDSGLLDKLLPVFEKKNQCRVDVVAVGTGAALRLGEVGDADVVVVHSRQAEEAFMAAEHGSRHEEFMWNDFLLLGPQDDPAEIRGLPPVEALRRILQGEHRFVSRGDNSGTHQREMFLWEQVGESPGWDDYIEGGQGMGLTLIMADEKQSYLLADSGTFFNFRDKIKLIPLAAATQDLRNPYAAIVVNAQKHDTINTTLANAFVDFLIGNESQQIIARYQIAGRQLFYPTRLDRGS